MKDEEGAVRLGGRGGGWGRGYQVACHTYITKPYEEAPRSVALRGLRCAARSRRALLTKDAAVSQRR